MGEIPEDVMAAARELFVALTTPGGDYREHVDDVSDIAMIARAILAERERGAADLAELRAWRAAFPDHELPGVKKRREELREKKDG